MYFCIAVVLCKNVVLFKEVFSYIEYSFLLLQNPIKKYNISLNDNLKVQKGHPLSRFAVRRN